MTSVAIQRGRASAIGQALTPQWLATVLVMASLTELVVLRIGTRTAIHVPGIEEMAGPYRLISGAGRLAFHTAVAVLGVLLLSLSVRLVSSGQSHVAAALAAFAVAAGSAGLDLTTSRATAVVLGALVLVLSVAAVRRHSRALALAIGLFAASYLLGSLPKAGLVAEGTGSDSLLLLGEILAVAAALSTGPLVRRASGLRSIPSRGQSWAAVIAGSVVTASLLASPSTASILMLWNFGLTGFLPPLAYGLATASLVIAISSSLKHHPTVALSLALLVLGGATLTSTYQSGLVVAALGLLAVSPQAPATHQQRRCSIAPKAR